MKRIKQRGERITLFEKKQKLAKVWQTYKALPEKFGNVMVINGEKPIKEVLSQVKEIVLSK